MRYGMSAAKGLAISKTLGIFLVDTTPEYSAMFFRSLLPVPSETMQCFSAGNSQPGIRGRFSIEDLKCSLAYPEMFFDR